MPFEPSSQWRMLLEVSDYWIPATSELLHNATFIISAIEC